MHFELGSILVVGGMILAQWVWLRDQIKDLHQEIALLQRDQQWFIAQLKKWGMIAPPAESTD